MSLSRLPGKIVQRNWQTCILLIIFILFDASDANVGVNVLFDEKLQHGPVSSRPLYSLDSPSISLANTPGMVQFCVANTNANLGALQSGLNWACGSGGANCSAIQPGQPCYDPNNLPAVASYAYNDYYQRTQAMGGTCSFNNTAVLTSNDPSHGSCIFTGSSGAGSSTGGGGGGTSTNSSSGGGSTFPNNPSFGPSPLDNSVSKVKFPKLIYLIMPLIFFLS